MSNHVWHLEIHSNDRDVLVRYVAHSIWKEWPTLEQVINHFKSLSKDPGDYGLLLDALTVTQAGTSGFVWTKYPGDTCSASSFPIAPPSNPLCKDSHWTASIRCMPVVASSHGMKKDILGQCGAACRIVGEIGLDQAAGRTTAPAWQKGWQNRDALSVFTGVAFLMLDHGMAEEEAQKSLLAICKAVKDEFAV